MQVTIVTTRAAGADARRRLLSALARDRTVGGVFFYSDGVEAAAGAERHAWQALARRHGVPLVLCAASAQRRGLAPGGQPPAGFQLAGIGRFAELAEAADTIDVAGRQ